MGELLAERFDGEERSRRKHLSAASSRNYRNVGSLSRYCISEQLHAEARFLRETALENGKSDWSGTAACDEGLKLSDKVSRSGKF